MFRVENNTKSIKRFILWENKFLINENIVKNISKKLLENLSNTYNSFIENFQWENPLNTVGFIYKNRLLESYSISKAEYSKLTIDEAKEVFDKWLKDIDYKKEKDYEKLELLRINETQSYLESFDEEFDIDIICDIHRRLTFWLDWFKDSVSWFLEYNQWELRKKNNVLWVWNYKPVDYNDVSKSLDKICMKFLNRKRLKLEDIFKFHVLLYSIHPFQNWNKRLCRTLESFLLKKHRFQDEFSSMNLFYYKFSEEFIQNFSNSLLSKNLSPFINLENTFFINSKLDVISNIIREQYLEWIKDIKINKNEWIIMKEISRTGILNYSTLRFLINDKMSEQTFVNNTKWLIDKWIIRKDNNWSYIVVDYSNKLDDFKELINTIQNNWFKVRKKYLLQIQDQETLLSINRDIMNSF